MANFQHGIVNPEKHLLCRSISSILLAPKINNQTNQLKKAFNCLILEKLKNLKSRKNCLSGISEKSIDKKRMLKKHPYSKLFN